METPERTPNAEKGSSIELLTLTVVGTVAIGAAVLTRLGWKHLRSKSVAPADSPIVVE